MATGTNRWFSGNIWMGSAIAPLWPAPTLDPLMDTPRAVGAIGGRSNVQFGALTNSSGAFLFTDTYPGGSKFTLLPFGSVTVLGPAKDLFEGKLTIPIGNRGIRTCDSAIGGCGTLIFGMDMFGPLCSMKSAPTGGPGNRNASKKFIMRGSERCSPPPGISIIEPSKPVSPWLPGGSRNRPSNSVRKNSHDMAYLKTRMSTTTPESRLWSSQLRPRCTTTQPGIWG